MGQDNSVNKKTYICEFCHKEQKRINKLFHQKICQKKHKGESKKINGSFSGNILNSYKDFGNGNNYFNNMNYNTESVNSNYQKISNNSISNDNMNNINTQSKNIISSNNINPNTNTLSNSSNNNNDGNTINNSINSNNQRIKINSFYKYGRSRETSNNNNNFKFAPVISSGQASFNYIGNRNDNNARNENNNNSNNIRISQNQQNNNHFNISSFALSSTAINNFEIRPENPEIRSRVDIYNNSNILSQLPENKIEDLNKLNEENKRCIICLEEYNIGDITIVLPCFHFFHKSCMINWYKRKATCPLCKLDIKSNI